MHHDRPSFGDGYIHIVDSAVYYMESSAHVAAEVGDAAESCSRLYWKELNSFQPDNIRHPANKLLCRAAVYVAVEEPTAVGDWYRSSSEEELKRYDCRLEETKSPQSKPADLCATLVHCPTNATTFAAAAAAAADGVVVAAVFLSFCYYYNHVHLFHRRLIGPQNNTVSFSMEAADVVDAVAET